MANSGNSNKAAFANSYQFPGERMQVQKGLTKREYFAGLFTQAIVSSIDSEENYNRLKSIANYDGMSVSQWIARDGVKQADALLAELEKK